LIFHGYVTNNQRVIHLNCQKIGFKTIKQWDSTSKPYSKVAIVHAIVHAIVQSFHINVDKTIITHPPIISISIGDMFTIPKRMYYYCVTHITLWLFTVTVRHGIDGP
jgi:hypothetical protein